MGELPQIAAEPVDGKDLAVLRWISIERVGRRDEECAPAVDTLRTGKGVWAAKAGELKQKAMVQEINFPTTERSIVKRSRSGFNYTTEFPALATLTIVGMDAVSIPC